MRPHTTSIPLTVCLAAVACLGFSQTLFAQSTPFGRLDTYDFRGLHALQVYGRSPDELNVSISVPSDFRLFKLRVKPGVGLGPNPAGPWWLNKAEIDADNNGTIDQTIDSETVFSHTFPEPPNGVRQTHTMRFVLQFLNASSQSETRTVHIPVDIYAAPQVYKNDFGDVFIQPRNEIATNKTPILIVEGIDPNNQAFAADYYATTFDFVNTHLHPANYETFFLNFKDGARSLSDNADVVRQALVKVNQLCPNKRIALVGMSMGGVICRYALAKLEGQLTPHHVGLFISYDSPQKSAHVNRQFQDLVRQAPVGSDAVAPLQRALGTQAAMEMLEYCTYNQLGDIHDNFYAELNALNSNGYPHQSYNVAVANGNYNASWPTSIGSPLATLAVHSAGIVWQKELEFSVSAAKEDCEAGSLADLATRRTGSMFVLPFAGAFFNAYYELTINFDPIYIPTWSALDLVGHNTDAAGNITPSGTSKFDDTFTQSEPKRHGDFTPGTGAKLLAWLGLTYTHTVSYNLQDGGAIAPDVYTLGIFDNHVITVPPKTVTVNGQEVTYKFLRWSDGSILNPRTFEAAHDGEHTIVMKAHRITEDSGAGWQGNQRRIAEATDAAGPTHHALYESNGTIWHLRNRHNAGWEQERSISFGSQQHDPTVTTQSFSNNHLDLVQVHTAWLGTDEILYRASNLDNGLTWMPPVHHYEGAQHRTVILPDANCAAPGAPNPCWPSLFWVDGGAEGFFSPGVYYMKQARLGEGHLVPGTDGDVTLTAATYSGDCGFGYHVVFVRDGSIHHVGMNDPDSNTPSVPPVLCSSVVDLTTPGWTATSPSIVSTGASVIVAWEESRAENRRIAVKERVNGTWLGTRHFTHASHVVEKPVLGIDNACGMLNLLWQCGEHIARVTRPLAGTLWAPLQDMGPGRSPSVVASATHKAVPMWTSGTTSPYHIDLVTSLPCASGETGVGVERDEIAATPHSFALFQNQPNPFIRSTVIAFELPRAERIKIEIFDLQGRLVKTPVDQVYEPGRWSIPWDGKDEFGAILPGALYFYRMTAGDFRAQRNLIRLP